ncbi:hypothetical protein AMK59_3642, partial [Oryctes borbonicus]
SSSRGVYKPVLSFRVLFTCHLRCGTNMQGGCRLSLNCDSSVKDLQALLFPISPRKSDSFLSNFFLKSTSSPRLEIEEEQLEQVVRFKDAKEYTAKDADCPSQPARWPTECQ